MNKNEQIAWQWIIQQPALGAFEQRIQPVDFGLQSNLNRIYSMLIAVPPLAECIRQRALLYHKAGCKGGHLKTAIKDYLEAAK